MILKAPPTSQGRQTLRAFHRCTQQKPHLSLTGVVPVRGHQTYISSHISIHTSSLPSQQHVIHPFRAWQDTNTLLGKHALFPLPHVILFCEPLNDPHVHHQPSASPTLVTDGCTLFFAFFEPCIRLCTANVVISRRCMYLLTSTSTTFSK